MREYRLDRLQIDKKGIELTYFTYTGQKGEEETVKLSHIILDKKDMDTIKAAIEKAGSSAENF